MQKLPVLTNPVVLYCSGIENANRLRSMALIMCSTVIIAHNTHHWLINISI